MATTAQIEELLKEVNIKQKDILVVQEFVEELRSLLLNSKPSKSFDISDAEKIFKGIKLPIPESVQPQSGEDMKCTPPQSVNVVGSFLHDTFVKNLSYVDVAVELPEQILKRKDYLNHKYHVKKAVYLMYLVKVFKKAGYSIKYSAMHGSLLNVSILIQHHSFTFQVFVIPPNTYFKPSRFLPTTNNLRFSHFYNEPSDNEFAGPPTPNYNHTILKDLLLHENQKIYENLRYANFQCAVKVLKVWLQQRLLYQGFGCFSGYILSAVVTYMHCNSKISSSYSVIEVLRAVLKAFCDKDMTSSPLDFSNSTASLEEMMMSFDTVFLDKSGFLNYMADVSKYTYSRLQFEARRTLLLLDDDKISTFQSLFLNTVPFQMNFDHVLQLKCGNISNIIGETNKELLLNYSGNHIPVVRSVLADLIRKGMDSRLELIDHELQPNLVWCTDVALSTCNDFCCRLGFIIVREKAYKLVEKSESDSSKAELFKQFWRDISQLRRFKDGTMCETIYFKNKGTVMQDMAYHIIQRHLKVESAVCEAEVQYINHQLENWVDKGYLCIKNQLKKTTVTFNKGKRKKKVLHENETERVSADAISDKAFLAYDELGKALRSLTGLPLEIHSLQPASATIRFTNVYPTPPRRINKSSALNLYKNKVAKFNFKKLNQAASCDVITTPKLFEPILVVIHLETSGKWPDNLEAIERLKAALMMRIGKFLSDQLGYITYCYSKHLDVVKNGFVFRLVLVYHRESYLRRVQVGSDGVIRVRDNPSSIRHERELIILPHLSSTMHSFQRQYLVFGQTCRIVKRWLASQLLLASPLAYNQNLEQPDVRFMEESIELLVAHTFLNFSPYLKFPSEAQLGFLRFLMFLSTVEWKSTPIIINFFDKMTAEDISSIELDFVKRRDQLPSLYIVSPEDKSSIWTKHLSSVILVRAQLLAKQALNLCQSFIFDKFCRNTDDLLPLFTSDTSDFDLILYVKRNIDARRHQRLNSSSLPTYYQVSVSEEISFPIIDYDPVQLFLTELRNTLGHLALFLHDNYGGNIIAVIWKPDAFSPQRLTISAANSRTLVNSELVANFSEVVETIELLGIGIIEKMELCKEYAN